MCHKTWNTTPLKGFYTLFHLNTCLPELCDRCRIADSHEDSQGEMKLFILRWLTDIRAVRYYEWAVWDCSLKRHLCCSYFGKALLLQILLPSMCETIWQNFLVWDNSDEHLGGEPVHTRECIVTVGPVIGQEVDGRRPAQEFDSWRQSSCSDKFLCVLKWLFSSKSL